jgi:oligoendopeptidase F
VSGYSLGFENFAKGGELENLFKDVGPETTMFRIVCKSNLTLALAEDLTEAFIETLAALDSLEAGYQSIRRVKEELRSEAEETALLEGMSTQLAASTILAAEKWKKKTFDKAESKKKMIKRMSLSHSVC